MSAAPPVPRHVYVHVPFCRRRCTYCDFSIAVRRDVPVADYLRALERELAIRFGDVTRGDVDTLYLGGGTPSLLGADGVERLVAALGRRFAVGRDAEVTLEANPEDVTESHVRVWRATGIDRISIGAQSFDRGVLAWMHRAHEPEDVRRAFDAARAGGIVNVSLDLIFALPASLRRDWQRDLDLALALAPDHMSVYGLTVEPGTPLGRRRARGELSEAAEGRYAREFLAAHDFLSGAGYEHYEVSNFARPGRRSRHNSAYWRRTPYAGLGPSAHEFDGSRRRWNVGPYAEWLRHLDRGEDPVSGSELLGGAEQRNEVVYLGLRTSDGLVLDEAAVDQIAPWTRAGWAVLDGRRLRLTPTGWLRLDTLAASLT